MQKRVEDEVVYYYDSHPTQEDLMGETSFHSSLVGYLILVLRWLFRGQLCAVYENLNFYQTPDPNEYPLAPDVAVIKGVAFQDVRSWRVGRTGPAPHVVFEIVKATARRLFGWRLDNETQVMRELSVGLGGRLWSVQLDSFLVPDGKYLRLYYRYGQLQLTEAEAEARRAEAAVRRAQIEARRAEAEVRRARALAEKVRSLGIDPDLVV